MAVLLQGLPKDCPDPCSNVTTLERHGSVRRRIACLFYLELLTSGLKPTPLTKLKMGETWLKIDWNITLVSFTWEQHIN